MAKDQILNKFTTIQVQDYVSFIPDLLQYFQLKVSHFRAGRLSSYIEQWKLLTSDDFILDLVKGAHIELLSAPIQTICPQEKQFSCNERQIIGSEIKSLLAKGVIVPSVTEPGEFISPIFLTPKKDGSYRMILNLKHFNTHVAYYHFKMDTLASAINLMKPHCFMASVDLKDAYYSVPVSASDQKYLKFTWDGQLFHFVCFPNGLACCPRLFTKLLKPVYARLRQQGHESSGYIDDSYLQGDDFPDCVANVKATVCLFDSLGFITHPDKSVLIPTQRLTYLGFILDSIEMKIFLTPEKAERLIKTCLETIDRPKPTIQEIASLVGMMTASFPGVMYGPLHYRSIDMDKNDALKESKGNFNSHMTLSPLSIEDLHWWVASIPSAFNVVRHSDYDLVLHTDASTTGWGGVMGDISTGGQWTPAESLHHINYLEILAVLMTLKAFCENVKDKHVHVRIDNTTAVATINHMGTSHSRECNLAVRLVWTWCVDNNVWLSAAHIPGVSNTPADKESRQAVGSTEWALDPSCFAKAVRKARASPNIDLFASRLNYKLKPYVAFKPDPEACAINAFSISWSTYSFYAFPPFSILPKVLQKILSDKATGLLVIPKWPTQAWWPRVMRMLIQEPIQLPIGKHTLTQPSQPSLVHPLYPKLILLLCQVSGDFLKTVDFHSKLPNWSSSHGGKVLASNTTLTLNDGSYTVVKDKLIRFQHL